MEFIAIIPASEFRKPVHSGQGDLSSNYNTYNTYTTDTINIADTFVRFDDIYTSYMRLSYCFPQPYQDLSIHNTYNNNNNDNDDNIDNVWDLPSAGRSLSPVRGQGV
ncbi:MAG: hypothetical protein M1347_02735 [Chloroflexi bacterium]|nr:hypothetical protein [Chloroflexota bacterium]